MKTAKGQVTVFVLTGIVIVLLVIIALLFKSYVTAVHQEKDSFTQLTFQEKVQKIQGYIHSCLLLQGEAALEALGKQGGFLGEGSFQATPYGNVGIAYQGKKQQILFPSIENIQRALAHQIEQGMKECSFAQFPSVTVRTGEPSVIPSFNQEDTSFQLTWNVAIDAQGQSSAFQTFEASVPVRMGSILAAVYGLLKDPYRTNVAMDEGISVTVFPYQGYTLFVVYDEQSVIEKTNYVFFLVFT